MLLFCAYIILLDESGIHISPNVLTFTPLCDICAAAQLCGHSAASTLDGEEHTCIRIPCERAWKNDRIWRSLHLLRTLNSFSILQRRTEVFGGQPCSSICRGELSNGHRARIRCHFHDCPQWRLPTTPATLFRQINLAQNCATRLVECVRLDVELSRG